METVKIAPLPGGVLYVSRVGVDTKCNKRFILGNNNQFFIWLRYLLVQWLALIDKILGRYDNVELKLPEDEEGNGEEMVDTGFDS